MTGDRDRHRQRGRGGPRRRPRRRHHRSPPFTTFSTSTSSELKARRRAGLGKVEAAAASTRLNRRLRVSGRERGEWRECHVHHEIYDLNFTGEG